MRIGIIGLGDIAQKAYLPVLAARGDVEPRLLTRNREVLDRLGAAYRIDHRHTVLADLLDDGIDAAFVHTATEAHAPVVAELLAAGVHVYVDKPLAYHYAQAQRLVELAEQHNRTLVVGFNRRYAPAYVALRTAAAEIVVMQKNRRRLLDAPRVAVFDDFIHVVDTIRFLLPAPAERVEIQTKVRDGMLRHVVLQMSGPGFTGVGIMSRDSGSTEESVEVIGAGHKRRVVNLDDVVHYSDGETHTRSPDWAPVARRRGIEQICNEFLDAVRDERVLAATDALATHARCEDIAQAAESIVSDS